MTVLNRFACLATGLAALAIQASPVSAYPVSMKQNYTVVIKYTTVQPRGDWKSPKFDDASWETGKAPLGTLPSCHTKWASQNLWIRVHLDKVTILPHQLNIQLLGVGKAQAFLDGKTSASMSSGSGKGATSEFRPVVLKGAKVYCLHCWSGAPHRAIDFSWLMVRTPPRPAPMPMNRRH